MSGLIDMNLVKARKQLRELGFSMSPTSENFGTIEAEPYNVGKDHFRARNRNVYIGTSKTGAYVTSHISGWMRKYRCRNENEITLGNIFGGGKTLEIAMNEFVANFQNKTYNVTAR